MDQVQTRQISLKNAALAVKINQMLTLSRDKKSEKNFYNLNHAIHSLDGILLECQDFVEELINNPDHDKSNDQTDALIQLPETSTPCRKESLPESPKVFLGAIQSFNFGIFGKPKKPSRFSFDSIKNQINKIVYSYRIPTPPLEKELPEEPESPLVVRKSSRSAHF